MDYIYHSFACLKYAAGAGAALKSAAPAYGSDKKKICCGSGAALTVAAPGGSGSATLNYTYLSMLNLAFVKPIRRLLRACFCCLSLGQDVTLEFPKLQTCNPLPRLILETKSVLHRIGCPKSIKLNGKGLHHCDELGTLNVGCV